MTSDVDSSPTTPPPAEADLVVIGSGPSGQQVALRGARAGLRTVLVEGHKLGGTCPLRGCDPKKALWEIVHACDQARRFADDGIVGARDLALHWDRVIERKRHLVGGVSAGTADKMREAGVTVAIGEACFTGPRRVTVAGQHAIDFERVVIATGARPRTLQIPGADLALTSDHFLDRDWLPARLICIGGGYIGMELGCLAAAAGCAVQVVTPHQRPLKDFDPGCVDALVEHWRDRGLEVIPQRRVVALEPHDGDGVVAILDDERRLVADQALHAAGRVPATGALQLEAAGIAAAEDGTIRIDADCRCEGNDAAWAIGDCASAPQLRLTPVANRQARWVADQITGNEGRRPDFTAVPSVAFTLPPVARVGRRLDEVDADATLVRDLSAKARFRRLRQPGRIALARDADGHLAGAHLLGPQAEEVINLFALALGGPEAEAALADLITAYPAFAAVAPAALRKLLD